MIEPRVVIEHVKQNIDEYSKEHPDIKIRCLKAILLYRTLYYFQTGIVMSHLDAIRECDQSIGLIGPGSSMSTRIIDYFQSRYEIFRSHVIIHNSYGQFYINHHKNRGYCYSMNKSFKFMKKSPLCGHISGLLWLLSSNICV